MNLAFIGTGKIVVDALYATGGLKKINPAAIWVHTNKEKAEELQEEYQIGKIYTDYDELLDDPEIDTCYIGVINSEHYNFAKKALAKGKHVILEKPFTATFAEAVELAELATEKELFLFEAVTILHTPLIKKMIENASKIGRIKHAQLNYSQYSSRYDDYLAGKVAHSFDPKHNGGALYDLNIYNIHYLTYLFGLPNKGNYHANLGFNGVDTSGTLILEYPTFIATLTASKDSDSPGFVIIQGEKGYLKIEGKPNIAEKLFTVYLDEENTELVEDKAGAMVRPMKTEKYAMKIKRHRMTFEFEEFVEIIETKDFARRDEFLKESLAAMQLLEKARIQAGIEA